MGTSDTYIDFCRPLMEFAFFPHDRRHVQAVAMGVQARRDAGKRIAAKVRECVGDVSDISSKLLRRMEMRMFPLYV